MREFKRPAPGLFREHRKLALIVAVVLAAHGAVSIASPAAVTNLSPTGTALAVGELYALGIGIFAAFYFGVTFYEKLIWLFGISSLFVPIAQWFANAEVVLSLKQLSGLFNEAAAIALVAESIAGAAATRRTQGRSG